MSETDAAALRGHAWREALGPLWRAEWLLIAAFLFVAGFGAPLADPDLSLHLATGEWIVKHHAVPFTEPFAWTRPGAPFLAYSWAIEALYYALMAHVGPFGLSVLQGLIYVALAGAMVVLGRAAGWNPWVVVFLVAGNLIVTLGATPYVRPQTILLIVTPLMWALVHHALGTPRLALTLAGLMTGSAVLANTHLLFPIAAAPCVLLLTRPPAERRRIVLVPLAIVAGWYMTPYAIHWPDVFALNFGPNLMYGPPTAIDELKPGYLMVALARDGSLVVAILLTILPWATALRLDPKARILYGSLWLAGLFMFALAVRSLVIWWLLTLPLAGLALSSIPLTTVPAVRTAQRTILPAIFALLAMGGLGFYQDQSLRAGGQSMRYLPSGTGRAIEPLAKWLDCNTRRVGGRLVTTFNYGGYIPWRLPYLSESIDGRTIFPDSVARSETYLVPARRDFPLQPWRTAELAIFPAGLPVAAVLDTAQGWHRVAMTSEVEGRARMIALWVTDKWWQRAGTIELPHSVLPVMHSLEPRNVSCTSLVRNSIATSHSDN